MTKGKTLCNGRFGSGKYGMVFCSECSGSGRSFNRIEGATVCETCQGHGVTKEEENVPHLGDLSLHRSFQ